MAEEQVPPLEPGCVDLDELLIFGNRETRRQFIKQVAGTSAAITIGADFVGASAAAEEQSSNASPATPGNDSIKVNLKINGKDHALDVDPRTTLLDALRE